MVKQSSFGTAKPLARVIAALTLAVVALLAACAQAAPAPEPVTIRFACPADERDHYQQLADAYQQDHPWVTVELVPRDWDMLGGIDLGGLEAEKVDAFVSSQFALNWLREGGQLLNLSPFIEQDAAFQADDFYRGMLGLYTADGKIWGIPAGVDMLVMYYNRDLFERYGVSHPQPDWTWEEFLAAAASLRDVEAGVFGFGANPSGVFEPIVFMYQHGGRIFDDLQNPTHTTFDDPLAIEGLEWYLGLMSEYNVAPTPEQLRDELGGSLQAGVLAGKVGMWTGMLSERGGRDWPAPWNMAWGVLPLPRDRQAATLTLVEGYFIMANTPHPDACWEWLSFLSRRLPDRAAPARRSLAEAQDYSARVGEDVAQVARSSMEGALLLSPELAQFEDVLAIFGNALGRIFAGTATPEEALIWAQRQAEQRSQ
jgi:multiple sugar transport system substrate-binding protein